MKRYINVKPASTKNFYKARKKVILWSSFKIYFKFLSRMWANLRLSVLALVWILSIYFYYFFYSFHSENKAYFLIYLIIAFCVYGVYKLFQSLGGEVRKFKLIHLCIFFLLQLFVISCMFAWISGFNFFLGCVIFFKVISFLVLAGALWLVIYSFGRTLFSFIKYCSVENEAFKALWGFWIGFFSFILGLFFLAAVWFYTPVAISGLILFMAGVSFKQLKDTFLFLKSHEWKYNLLEDRDGARLFIDEMHFFVISLLLSVNFLSVFRPFPIGWDDLGAYMNLPKILAQEEWLVAFGRNYVWELYTGVGHVFSSQTFAFFLNSFSGVLLAIVSYIALKGILKPQKTLFNLPLLGVMLFLMMPMTIFQLAKDMKLDIGLFAMSIIPFFMAYTYIGLKRSEFSHKQLYMFAWVIGLLVGFCFTIKITSLLLLLGIMALISYKRFSIFWLLGFFGIFLWVFTILDIWHIMKVSFPHSHNIFGGISIVLWMASLIFGIKSTQAKAEKVKFYFSEVSLLVLGFIIAILPWGIKNIVEFPEGESMNIRTLITGKSESYKPDYSLFYSQDELKEINSAKQNLWMTSEGTTTNEDFWRYFWYEGWINNYLKLPWNLSYQENQKGEFTDITFIFFALIPAIFLFLPFRNELYKIPLVVGLLFLLLYYIPGFKLPMGFNSDGGLVTATVSNSIWAWITKLFDFITLPFGYIIILLFFILPFAYFFSTLKRDDKNVKIFLSAYAFCIVYVFLWNISSFGVVWYGILMYFVFFLMIGASLLSAHEQEDQKGYIGVFLTVWIIWVYVILSAIPHAIDNMRIAGQLDYKLWKLTEEEALMKSHGEYFPILFELNIKRELQEDMFREYRNKLLHIVDDVPESSGLVTAIGQVPNMIFLRNNMNELIKFDLWGVENQIRELRQELYENVLFASAEVKSTDRIYRVGTFMKYYISENNRRLFEDSLVDKFDKYVYDEDPEVIKDRFEKLGIWYILLDLNAATIDQDPSRQLTKRYEKLLSFTNHKDITLVETDSICLKLARDDYKKLWNEQVFLDVATLNHGNRLAKKTLCINRITDLLKSKTVSATNYPYLYRFSAAMESLNVDLSNEAAIRSALNKYVGQWYKALFKIN